MNIRRVSLSLIAISALAVSACGASEGPTGDTSPITPGPVVATTSSPGGGVGDGASPTSSSPAAAASEPSSAPVQSTGEGAEEINASALQAVSTAEESAGGAAVKLDDEDFDRAWEVDVLVGNRVVEVKVNREGTEVLETADDDALDDGETAQPGDLIAAAEAALGHTPGVIDDVELETDDGVLYWSVELDGTDGGDDVELRVDTRTGAVTPEG